MIGTLPTEAKIRWQEHLPRLVHAYNSSHSNTTGFGPFYLMYGRQPMLPIDVQSGMKKLDIISSTSHSYIQKLQKDYNGHINCLEKLVRKNQNTQKEGKIKM